jgi:uncharacterized membrane protein YqjE
MPAAPRHEGLLASLKGLLGTSLGLLQNRIELLGIELAEERGHLLTLVAYGAAAFVFLGAGLVFLAVLITLLFWDTHPLLVLSLFAGAFLVAGWLALRQALCRSRIGSKIFSASLAELRKDRAALSPKDTTND